MNEYCLFLSKVNILRRKKNVKKTIILRWMDGLYVKVGFKLQTSYFIYIKKKLKLNCI